MRKINWLVFKRVKLRLHDQLLGMTPTLGFSLVLKCQQLLIIKYFHIWLACWYCCLEGICIEKQRGLFSGINLLGAEPATQHCSDLYSAWRQTRSRSGRHPVLSDLVFILKNLTHNPSPYPNLAVNPLEESISESIHFFSLAWPASQAKPLSSLNWAMVTKSILSSSALSLFLPSVGMTVVLTTSSHFSLLW